MSVRRLVPMCLMFTMLVAVPATTFAQTPEERVAARAVLKAQGDAAVMALATLKTRIVVNGREQSRDVPMQTNGLTIGGDGLTIMPLSALEPGDLLTRSLTANASPTQKVEVSSETTELRIRYSDGVERPASIVLRDSDLDLAFLRPTEAPALPVPFMTAAPATAQPLDLLLVVQRGPERDGWRAFSAFATVAMVAERPRAFLSVSGSVLVGNGLGAAFFTPAGGFVGMLVRVGGSAIAPTAAILPAADILELAKQVK